MKTTIRVFAGIVLFLSVGFLLRKNREQIRNRFQSESISASIRGNVVHPGVYRLHKGDTLDDLVRLAGGLKKTSVLELNLDREILDGQTIELKE
ncbi:SLBB domain-containing protein [Leptospira kirschneri]|uniref:SLBB domain-containing protein n=1 Tax=Leptospira kirschneri TaxID=29507 RepID=UPI0002F9B4DB|nr:SLBB domain-containing protein [Leptospira kirschneri]